MTTTPSREDWETKAQHTLRLVPSSQRELFIFEMSAHIAELLKNHNNALVAEIEKLKLVGTEYVGHLNSEGFNRALDTIIRIIQEK